jgi:hypothetical protein
MNLHMNSGHLLTLIGNNQTMNDGAVQREPKI